ncbi:MAG: RNA polymerase sigma factor [Methylococcales bacterium]
MCDQRVPPDVRRIFTIPRQYWTPADTERVFAWRDEAWRLPDNPRQHFASRSSYIDLQPIFVEPGRDWTKQDADKVIGWLYDNPRIERLSLLTNNRLSYSLDELGFNHPSEKLLAALQITRDFITGHYEKGTYRNYDPGRSMYWEYVINLHHYFCLDWHAHPIRETLIDDEAALNELSSEPSPVQDPCLQQIESEELSNRLHSNIEELDPDKRMVISLWLHDRSFEEIAKIVNKSCRNVTQLKHRAIEDLKKRMGMEEFLQLPKTKTDFNKLPRRN